LKPGSVKLTVFPTGMVKITVDKDLLSQIKIAERQTRGHQIADNIIIFHIMNNLAIKIFILMGFA